jgi:ABC-type microcin C transport system duplicated ATPase subunit YejF
MGRAEIKIFLQDPYSSLNPRIPVGKPLMQVYELYDIT